MFRQRESRSAAGGRRLASLAAIALLAFGLAVAPAAANDRYVTPSGTGLQCTQLIPCDLETGINEAVSGDAVHVAGDLGAYAGLTATYTAGAGVTVVGEGAQVPQLLFDAASSRMSVLLGGSIARLDLRRTGGTPTLLSLRGTGSALRLETAGAVPAEVIDGLLRDSFVHTESANTAVGAFGTSANLRNVTAVADGTGAVGVSVDGFAFPPGEGECQPGTVELRNVIARGAGFDLSALSEEGCPATLNVGFSNYGGGAVKLFGTTAALAALIDQGGNQTGLPPLLGPDGFHQLAGSPTINAGIATPENGPVDIDGEPRWQDSAPDIGADEFPSLAATTDTTTPTGTRLRFAPRRFRPRRKRAPSIATASAKKRRKRTRRTSRVSYQLSEDAGVRFTVRRRVIGRRKGKRCLVGKRARRLRKAKKCKKLVRVKGAFTNTGSQGANRFRFSGYVRGRRLRPGAYRMVGVPTDAAGNHGHRFGASFVIARR